MERANCQSSGLNKAGLETQILAGRLEKSEAGRKKLRQAISILQEKLASSEKLLKAHENLQKECEQERQRAEREKKKAEEEKKLRVVMEKDSATVKDQLAKVFQRLGAVENKQKTDKKQVERLQNEVKLSVEGMRVAAEAVDAVQSSLQSLETRLLEKIDAAFKEAHTASAAVQQLQTSFQSLQNSVIKKGPVTDKHLLLSATNPVSEKLVDEISRLFCKEKQSHCKIEQRLSKLRSVLRQDMCDNSLTTGEDSDLENLAFSEMKERKVSKKRKSGGKEELLNWKARKRSRNFDVDVVHSAATRSSVDAVKAAYDGRSMSSPFSIECQMISKEPLRVPTTASNEYMGEAIVNHKGSSNGMAHKQVRSLGDEAQKETQRSSSSQRENVDSNPGVIKGCLKNTCLQDGGIQKMQSENLPHVMQHGILDQLAGEGGIHGRGSSAGRSNADMSVSLQIDVTDGASDLDLSFDDSDDEWWSQRVLLSPSLPDIPSPVHHSPFCSRDPSLLMTNAHEPDAALDLDSSAILDVPMIDSHGLAEAATSRTNVQDVDMQCGGYPVAVCLEELEVGSQKDMTIKSSSVQPGSHSKVTEEQDRSGANCQIVYAEKYTKVGTEGVQQSVQFSTLADEQGTEREFQLNDEFGFEAVDSATLAEFDKLLEVLPPIPLTLSKEPCAFESSKVNAADATSCEVIGLSNEVCISDHPQAAGERCTLRAVSMKDSKATNCSSKASSDGLQQITNLSQNASAQNLPIQDGSQTFEFTKNTETHSVLESSHTSDYQPILSSSTKPSSSTVIFLLQAFDLQGADAELNVIAACIMAINFKGYLQATTAEKEEMQLQGATFATRTASVPIEYVACSLISVVVDVVRLGNGEEHGISEANPSFVLVQEFVAFIRSMFKELANRILDSTFAQLGRFVVQGVGMLMTLHGSLSFCEDVLSSARVFQEQKYHSHQYREATLEDIHAGGKVLAALCQILSCVTHLQNVVYEVLGWCDKDVIWLLTVFSSFSSICGNSAFIVETDDILGLAVCAIILELVASVEQESIKTPEVFNSKVTTYSANVSSNLLLEWSTLKESLEITGNMSVEQVVLAVFKALRDIFSSAHEFLAVASMENKLLWAKDCRNNDTKQWQGFDFSKKSVETSVLCQEVSNVGVTTPMALSERQMDASCQGVKKWQKKYGEAVGALQLIVHFMGWEWAYNHLVIRYLWREVVPGSTQLCVAVVAHIFSILWRMGVEGGGTNLPGLAELRKCLVHISQSALINFEKFEHHLSAEKWASEAR